MVSKRHAQTLSNSNGQVEQGVPHCDGLPTEKKRPSELVAAAAAKSQRKALLHTSTHTISQSTQP